MVIRPVPDIREIFYKYIGARRGDKYSRIFHYGQPPGLADTNMVKASGWRGRRGGGEWWEGWRGVWVVVGGGERVEWGSVVVGGVGGGL